MKKLFNVGCFMYTAWQDDHLSLEHKQTWILFKILFHYKKEQHLLFCFVIISYKCLPS